jgi:hypothetical protein
MFGKIVIASHKRLCHICPVKGNQNMKTTKYAVKDVYGYWLTFSGAKSTQVSSHQTRKSDHGAADLFDTEQEAKDTARQAGEKDASVEMVEA